MQPKTVLDVYQQYRKTEVAKNSPRLIDNLRTILRRYILPVYNFSAADLRRDLENSLAQVSLDKFLRDAPQFLETFNSQKHIHAQNIAPVTFKNYRSTLLRFLNWIYDQDWKTAPPIKPSASVLVDSPSRNHTPQIYSGQTLSKARRGGKYANIEPYALKEEELTEKLKQQLEQLQNFWTNSCNLGLTEEPIDGSTSQSYRNSILCFLGWYQNILCRDLRYFHIKQLIQLDTLKAFIDWGLHERRNSYGWATNVANSTLAIARYLSSQTKGSQFESEQKAIQTYVRNLRSIYRQSPGSDISEASLAPDELEQIVFYLKQCCAPLHSSGVTRSETAILKSWERYLIVALLTYCPISQREVRELEWERSLIRDSEGYLLCLNTTTKTSDRNFRLPEPLVHDVDTWREEFHPKIPVQTNRVFVRLGSGRTPESFGQPLNSRDISDLVSTAIYKATSILFDQPKHSSTASFQRTAIAYLGSSMQQAQDVVADRHGLSSLKSQEPILPTAASLTELSKLRGDRANLPPMVEGLVEELNRPRDSDYAPSLLGSVIQAAQPKLERTDEQDNATPESLDSL